MELNKELEHLVNMRKILGYDSSNERNNLFIKMRRV